MERIKVLFLKLFLPSTFDKVTLIIPELLANFQSDSQVTQDYNRLNQLLTSLLERNIDASNIQQVNQIVYPLSNVDQSISRPSYLKLIKSMEKELLQFLRKQYGWYPRRYFTDQWLIIGVLGIGIPIGVLFVLFSKRNSFLILGLLIGSLLGQWIGYKKDQRIFHSGKQLNILNRKPKFI